MSLQIRARAFLDGKVRIILADVHDDGSSDDVIFARTFTKEEKDWIILQFDGCSDPHPVDGTYHLAVERNASK